MHRLRRPAPALAAGSLAAVLLAGCGGDDPQVSQPEDTGSPTSAQAGPTGEPTDTSTGETTAPTGTGTAGPTATAGPTQSPTTGGGGTGTAGPGEQAPEGSLTAADGSFAITLPEGWEDVSEDVAGQAELAARSREQVGGFYTNFLVSVAPTVPNLRASAEQTGRELAGEGGFEMLPDRTIDGEDAFGYVLNREEQGVEIAQTQWYTEHGDTLYVFTMSSAASEVEAANAVMDRVLQSWTWLD